MSRKAAATFESMDGGKDFGKDFLCDVICIVAIAQDAIGDAIDLACVALDDFAKSRLIPSLQSRYQLSVVRFALFRRRFVWPDAKGVGICSLRRGRVHICRLHSSHDSGAQKELREARWHLSSGNRWPEWNVLLAKAAI